MTTSNDPDQIRREIEQTQAALGQDVDALTDKVTPGRIVERRVDRVRSTARGWTDKVMGSTPLASSGHVNTGTHLGGGDTATTGQYVGDRVSATAGRVSDAASQATDRVSGAASSTASAVSGAASDAAERLQDAPQAVRRQTHGNPLAAGLIAFGVGWLVSSLLPTSRQEQQLAEQARERAQDLAQPLAQHAQEIGHEVTDNLREPAQQAVESVRSTAQAGAENLRGDARSATEQVQGRAQDAATTAKDGASKP